VRPESPENRVERVVSDLLRGRRLRLRGGDAEEKEAITAAARLAALSHGQQRMNPAFRRRLAEKLEAVPKEGWMTRRAALVAGLGVAAGALAGTGIERALQPAPETARTSGRIIVPTHGRWVDVGALADFTEGEGKPVKAGSVGAFVFRSGETVSAVSSLCSHLPCELWWDGSGSVLACPCHPVSFRPDGSPSSKSYPLPALDVVKSRVTASGRVELFGT
jgi:nitrite reductase/ring-hydroxylating ferredoxin subunit